MGVVFEISTMTVARTLIIPLLLQFLTTMKEKSSGEERENVWVRLDHVGVKIQKPVIKPVIQRTKES